MDAIRENEVLSCEAPEWAFDYVLHACRTEQPARLLRLLWNPDATFFQNVLVGTGTVINLFPDTHYKADDFRCWHPWADDAWIDDWYNVGADLCAALSKTRLELINGQSADTKSTLTAAKP